MISSPAERFLLRAEWQRVLFAERLRCNELLKLPHGLASRPLRINVHRNHAFEPIAMYLKLFLEYAGWAAEFILSGYDDSLGFHTNAPADVEILWIDYSRYSLSRDGSQLLPWLADRIQTLRNLSRGVIFVSDCDDREIGDESFNASLRTIAQGTTDVHIIPQSQISTRLADSYFDYGRAAMTGTRLSAAARLETARLLGCVSIPASMSPRLRAIITDLDNTLYEGVLGEDGPERILLKAEHAELQTKLARFRAAGVFLGVVSRNDPADVERLFDSRPDFPLRWADFSACSIGWGPKSQGILAVAAQLRIGADSVVFLGDNPGELAEVSAQVPGIRFIYAADPAEAARALEWYPGLNGYEETAVDTVRVDHLAAAALRNEQLAKAVDGDEYLRALNVQLEFALNPAEHSGRLHELSIKTNQFNTGFLRLSLLEVQRRLNDPDCAAVGIGLKDRLSDSGIVGAVFMRREAESMVVDEIAISCRALGRQMEDLMITEALRGACAAFARRGSHVSSIEFGFQGGPRNEPARAWLSRYIRQTPSPGARVSMPLGEFSGRRFTTPVSIRWKTCERDSQWTFDGGFTHAPERGE